MKNWKGPEWTVAVEVQDVAESQHDEGKSKPQSQEKDAMMIVADIQHVVESLYQWSVGDLQCQCRGARNDYEQGSERWMM